MGRLVANSEGEKGLYGGRGLGLGGRFRIDENQRRTSIQEPPTIMERASARHILVESEQQCSDLKSQIEGGADFAELAKKHSQCPSGQRGGELGEFGRGQMVPEFDKVVFTAPVNEVQGPVRTQFGYHLLEVTQRSE